MPDLAGQAGFRLLRGLIAGQVRRERFERGEPALVVRALGVALDLRDQAVAEVVPGDSEALLQRDRHRKDAALPRSGEDQLAVAPGRGLDPAQPRHLTRYRCHSAAPPTMPSRVTSAVSWSSSRSSVPAGRWGRTR